MVEQVVLHIGMHKTGSSSIQQSLHRYDDTDAFYATFPEPDHSQPIFTAFSDDYKNYHVWVNSGLSESEIDAKRQYYRSLLSEMLNRTDRRRLIVSAEDISILDPAEKSSLIDFIKGHNCEVSVVCYVREPAGYAASSFQQEVKGGLTDVPELIYPSYIVRLGHFMNILPRDRITVRVFGRSTLVDGDVVSDFCHVVGLDKERISPVTANIGLSLPAAKLIYLFNRQNIVDSGDVALYHARLRLIWAIQEKYFDCEKMPSKIFGAIADFSEVQFLNKNFDVGFEEKSSVVASGFTVDDIRKMFVDLSDVDVSRLDSLLSENGVVAKNFKSIEDKIIRLYMAFVADEICKAQTSARFIKDSDADVLRDIAFKIDSDEKLEKRDALRLLRIAMRARPHGHLIKMKIEEIISSL